MGGEGVAAPHKAGWDCAEQQQQPAGTHNLPILTVRSSSSNQLALTICPSPPGPTGKPPHTAHPPRLPPSSEPQTNKVHKLTQ